MSAIRGQDLAARCKPNNDSLIPLRQIPSRAVRDGVIATNPVANGDRDDPLELPYERPTMYAMAAYVRVPR